MWQGQKGEGWGRETSAKGKANHPVGGGGTPIHYLYGYVPPNFRGVF